jgi:hypothetical protein
MILGISLNPSAGRPPWNITFTLHPLEFKYILNDNNQHDRVIQYIKDERLTKIFIDEIMHLMSDIDKKTLKSSGRQCGAGIYEIKYSIIE